MNRKRNMFNFRLNPMLMSCLLATAMIGFTSCASESLTETVETTPQQSDMTMDEVAMDGEAPIVMPVPNEGALPSVPAVAATDFTPQPAIEAVSVEEQLKRFILQPGYQMEAVLTEPEIMEPMSIAFDGNGRMFIMEMRTYMQDIDGTAELTPGSRISLHEDTDNDGVYDKHSVFVDNMLIPRFVTPYGPNSILTMDSNTDDVMLYTDTDGDGVADESRVFTTNFGRTANIEHQQSSVFQAMDNWLYSTHNSYRIRETPEGMIRETTGSTGGGGAWGVTQDNSGKTFVQGGHDGVPRYYLFPVRYGDFNWGERFQEGFEVPYGMAGVADYQGGPNMSRPNGTLARVTAGAGNDIVRGHMMPEDLQGDYLYGEVTARIVRRVDFNDVEGMPQMVNYYQDEEAEFIRTTDHLFRPVQMQTAPDGTVYIVDVYRGIIQEGNWTQDGSFLRQKLEQYSMDEVIGHGRVWRLSHDDFGRDTEQPRMNDESPAELIRHLDHPNGWWRDTAQRLIVWHGDDSIAPALEEMARNSDSVYGQIHAMWALEGLQALDADLVREMMSHPSEEMRIQALRLSETLYKAGDNSFTADYRELMNDDDTDVVIQAMLTYDYVDAPDVVEVMEEAMAANSAFGVQFIGAELTERILEPNTPNFNGMSEEEQELMVNGMNIYNGLCNACHGNDGTGAPVPGGSGSLLGAPLAGSPGVLGHKEYTVKTLLHGLQGPSSIMVSMGMNDDEWIASVASYIRNSFTNEASMVTPDDVAAVRAATADKETPYSYEELNSSIPVSISPDDSWVVTASHSVSMGVGSDGVPARAFGFEGWSTGEPQAEGMWYQMEFPEEVTLAEIEFLSPSQGGFRQPTRSSAPQAYVVEVSTDGQNWTEAAQGATAPDSERISINFEPVNTKFARITLTEDAGETTGAWTMLEMKVFVRP